MTEKVYITSKQMATFICPQCKRSKTVSVARYAQMDKVVRVTVRCPCGHAYSTMLEKRKKYRKQTNLPAKYIHLVNGKQVGQGLLTIRDLSAGGMKLKISDNHQLAVGDIIQVEFHLDDANRTLISKKVVIRNINRELMGTEFAPTEAADKALGFYLFS